MKKNIITIAICIVFCLLILFGFIIYKKNNSIESEASSNSFTSEANLSVSPANEGTLSPISNLTKYKDTYYTVNLPSDWAKKENDETDINFYSGDNYIAHISVNTDCNYCSTASSIFDNLFGLHGYVDGDTSETDFGNYKMIKAFIGYQQSASDKAKGITYPDELHYIYTNYKDYWIDLFIDTAYINEMDADTIANSLTPNLD